jgi:hypothetical protein
MFRVCGKSGGAAIEPIACGGFACGRALFRVSIRDETERLCRRWRLANPRVFVLVYQRNRGLDLARCSDVRLHDGRNGNRTFGEPLHEQAATKATSYLISTALLTIVITPAMQKMISAACRIASGSCFSGSSARRIRYCPASIHSAPVIWAGCFSAAIVTQPFPASRTIQAS